MARSAGPRSDTLGKKWRNVSETWEYSHRTTPEPAEHPSTSTLSDVDMRSHMRGAHGAMTSNLGLGRAVEDRAHNLLHSNRSMGGVGDEKNPEVHGNTHPMRLPHFHVGQQEAARVESPPKPKGTRGIRGVGVEGGTKGRFFANLPEAGG